MGALEASRDMETGQVASRAVPIPGPMVDQGARAAMKDPGTPWAMVGSPPPKKIYIYWGDRCLDRSGSADTKGRSGSDSVSSWTGAGSVPGAHRVHSWARSVPGAHRVHSWARSVPGAHRVHSWARSVPGAHRVHSWARSVPGAQRVHSWARSGPGAHRVTSRAPLSVRASRAI